VAQGAKSQFRDQGFTLLLFLAHGQIRVLIANGGLAPGFATTGSALNIGLTCAWPAWLTWAAGTARTTRSNSALVFTLTSGTTGSALNIGLTCAWPACPGSSLFFLIAWTTRTTFGRGLSLSRRRGLTLSRTGAGGSG
jgi:hypothetical protein